MSIFGSIVEKIFHANAKLAPTSQPAAHFVPTLSGTSIPGQPDLSAKPTSVAPVNAQPTVNAAAVLTELAEKNGSKLNWKESIVDLLKLLGLDSSHEARVTLAKELNYTGDFQDSAKMNIWLSQQVMEKLSQNGGKLPSDFEIGRAS